MRTYLSEGYKLINSNNITYTILKTLGEGASCVAYRAIDEQTGSECVIKEYYPQSISMERRETGELICINNEERYLNGIEGFKDAIERQISLRNIDNTRNSVFYVINSFISNYTIYVVTPGFTGDTYNSNQGISLYNRVRICKAVAGYVGKCHEAGYLCLDIKPNNIFVLPETPELALFFDYDSVVKKDEIIFGKTTSYSETWAAPEQLAPSLYGKISEATDIYILGEVLFWSIFDRHSRKDEHRRNSVNTIDDSSFSDCINSNAEKILQEIFNNTIRSSVKNRYKSVKELLEKIDILIHELYPFREKIIDIVPMWNDIFVGRNNEIEKIHSILEERHIAILTGVGGIGKSEISKQYVRHYFNEYKNVIYLTYNFDIVSTINYIDFISNYEQKEKESDEHYCNRKITKLSELINGKCLIVIDNLNVEIEELEHKGIWKKLIELSSDFLITSRCNQESYFGAQVHIDTMDNHYLIDIYKAYCAFEDSQLHYVHEIIETASKHTLVVELLAKHAKVFGYSPEEMYNILIDRGILRLGTANVKWDLKKASVADHIKGLFELSNIVDDQKELLIKMAYMPVAGISKKTFFSFYEIASPNTVENLIDNGWIYASNQRIAMHPIIAGVVHESFCDDMATKCFYEMTSKGILELGSREDINQDEFKSLCSAVVYQSMMHDCKLHQFADYIINFRNSFRKYGLGKDSLKILEYAIDIYEKIYPENVYAAVKEKAYCSRIYCINNKSNVQSNLLVCRSHLKLVKRNKDVYMQLQWLRAIIAIKQGNKLLGVFINLLKVAGLFSKLDKELVKAEKNERFKIRREEKYRRMNYSYLYNQNLMANIRISMAGFYESLSGNNVFFSKNEHTERVGLKHAINFRNIHIGKNPLVTSPNYVYRVIDEAKLCILERKYQEALSKLLDIINYYNEHVLKATSYLYSVYNMIGSIYLCQKEYESAIKYYEKGFEIAEELGRKKNYSIRIFITRAYLYMNMVEKAYKCNEELLEDIMSIDEENRGTLQAEIYYNLGCYYQYINEYATAKNYFIMSFNNLVKYENYYNRKYVGIARTRLKLGEIYLSLREDDEAAKRFKLAYKDFKERLGEQHIETIECKEYADKYPVRKKN